MKYTRGNVTIIHRNGQKYGGGFEKVITEALLRSDAENQRKLESLFDEIFEKFLKMNYL